MRKFRHDISIIPPKDVRFSGKSLSEYELILALIEKVNELIKYTNSVAELVYALEKWINDEFINAIDESTKKTLIEWRESGYLQELVEDYLVNLTVATSELLDEEEQKFEKSWHPVLDTKISIDKVPKEVLDENYAQNELLNGDFRNGLIGWKAEGRATNLEVNGNVISYTRSNEVVGWSGIRNSSEIFVNEGDVLYSGFYLKSTSENHPSDRLRSSPVGYFDDVNYNLSETGSWEFISSLLHIKMSGHLSILYRKYIEVEGLAEFSKIRLVNLTKLFGKGNEPSKEWCDENLKYYPNWQDLSDEDKPYTLMTLEKGSSDDLFLISKIQESNLQKHDSMVRLRNVGQPFIIKDGVSGKYVEVSKSKPLDPNVDGIPFNEYNLRNVFANITFSLHPDNTDGKIMVALDKSSIMHKVNLDEGFIWLVSRIDKLEDDMVIFEQWVREFVTTKITELENKVNKQIDDTVEYVDKQIDGTVEYVDKEINDLTQNFNQIRSDLKDIWVSVKDFGAKGDGVTDDTEAIQYCLDNFKNIYFPKGEYITTETLVMSKSGYNILGSSVYDVQIYKTTNNKIDGIDAVIGTKPDGYYGDFTIKNISFNGVETSPNDYIIFTGKTYRIVLEDLYALYGKHGVYMRQTWNTNIKKVRTRWCDTGFQIAEGINEGASTSIHFDNTFAEKGKFGYKLNNLTYFTGSAMSTDFIDECAYYFNFVSGSINGLGNEYSEGQLIHAITSTVNINGMFVLGLKTKKGSYEHTNSKAKIYFNSDNRINMGLTINNFEIRSATTTPENDEFLEVIRGVIVLNTTHFNPVANLKRTIDKYSTFIINGSGGMRFETPGFRVNDVEVLYSRSGYNINDVKLLNGKVKIVNTTGTEVSSLTCKLSDIRKVFNYFYSDDNYINGAYKLSTVSSNNVCDNIYLTGRNLITSEKITIGGSPIEVTSITLSGDNITFNLNKPSKYIYLQIDEV